MSLDLKHSSEKLFDGSKPGSFYDSDYFLKGVGGNYGRRDKDGNVVFAPYTEETYLPGHRQAADLWNRQFHPKNVLVLGAARGYLVKAFRELKIDAVGIDLSEWAVANCPEDIKDYMFVGDVCDLSKWPDRFFDLVVALDVWEHIRVPDLYRAITEGCRVGKNLVLDVPVQQSDENPDQSLGTDKSHVSVYSPGWWLAEIGRRGYTPATERVYDYPDGSKGATVTFRLEPRKTTLPDQVVVADGSKGFKILWLSNAPHSPSGYGVQTEGAVRRLLKYYNVRVEANFGQEGRAIQLNDLVVYPKLPMGDTFATDAARLDIAAWQPDVFITLYDIWPGMFTENKRGGPPTPIHPRWIPWIPVDSDPIMEQTVGQAQLAYKAVAMSMFGYEQLRRNGIEAYYIPHGVDTKVFRPAKDSIERDECKKQIDQFTTPINLQLKTQITPDDFVVGVVAANVDPFRKSFDRHMWGFKIFLDQNPDARKDTKMAIHSWREGGRSLSHTAHVLGVDANIKITLTNLMKNGVTTEQLAEYYRGFDVFLNCTQAEGFGVPILEACASGVPPIVTDFTSMPELAKGHGYIVPVKAKYMSQLDSFWAIPDEDKIADAIESAYNHGTDRKELGRKAREFSLEYDWEKIIAKWVMLLEEVRSEMGTFGINEAKDKQFADKAKEILGL